MFFLPVLAFAQVQEDANRPQRTPEQVAQKQTERLQRDLHLTKEQRDTIYKIHLKYARMRKPEESRDSVALRMSMMREELLQTMNDGQKEVFLLLLREIRAKRQAATRMKVAEAEAVVVQPDSIQ